MLRIHFCTQLLLQEELRLNKLSYFNYIHVFYLFLIFSFWLPLLMKCVHSIAFMAVKLVLDLPYCALYRLRYFISLHDGIIDNVSIPIPTVVYGTRVSRQLGVHNANYPHPPVNSLLSGLSRPLHLYKSCT